MSEEKKTERQEDVVVQEDGKATISDEAAERALDKQNADPDVKTTSEPAADSPAKELAEQQAGTSEMAGVAASADAGTEAGKVEGAKNTEGTADQKPAEQKPSAEKAAEKPAAEKPVAEKPAAKPAVDSAAADAEKEAKRKAAAEARAARAAARAPKEAAAEEAPKEPSPNQPKLDRLVAILKEAAGEGAVAAAWINETNDHLPVVEIVAEHWPTCARALKEHPELRLHYLRNVSGVDHETHMEVVYHLLNFDIKQDYCVKVKTNREKPAIPSITPVWSTANWFEREIYDLLGIDFPGHPDLRRILMPDDWVGHPLRKDYEPLDPEV